MSSEIHYCDKCGSIILPSAIEQGSAVVNAATTLCAECLKKLPPDEREAISALRAGAGTPDAMPMTAPVRVYPGDRRSRESTRGRAAAPAGGKKARAAGPVVTAVAVGVGAAVVSALVGIRLLRSGDSGPPHRPRATPTVSAPTAPPVAPSSSGAAPASGATGAARQLARIRAMLAIDESKYAEARRLLVRFPESFAGTPEVGGAKALLSEIDAAYAKRAEEALSAARAGASAGEFDEAESRLRSIRDRFGDGLWFESKGEAAVAEALAEVAKQRLEWELKNVADTLKKAREEFDAGRLKEAGTLIANRAKWPAASRAEVDKLAVEIERKVAAAAAAKKLAEEREKILAEFDRLVANGEYAAAREHAMSRAAGDGQDAGMLRAAAHVAHAMAEAPAAAVRGARTLVGREVRLKLARGHMTATVKAATDAGLAVATTYTINNQRREKSHDLKWEGLHADQKAELARLGGLEVSPSDAAIVSTYEALAANDLAAARKAVEAAGDHPLAARLAKVVRERQTQLAYESAMELAEELVEKKRWKAGKEECEKALEIKPDDEKATELLAEVRRHIGPPPTLTLDLGNGVTMECVYIRPGKFTMGGDSDPKHGWQGVEKPKHEVTITKGFYLGKYEVTQAQYEAVMGVNPSKWKEAQRPVEYVTWSESDGFCRRASEKTRREVRLPTEAEWEYACRAGTTTDWSHGSNSANLAEYAWYNVNAGGQTHPVGQKKPNGWGLYDMHGNVWEWVADWYGSDYYASGPREDPTGPTEGADRMLRGGGWDLDNDTCRSALRRRRHTWCRNANRGFRAAVSSPPRGP